MLDDYFEDNFLAKWRLFVSRLRQSKPFEELWNECCRASLGKEVILQPDTPTRWSSTVNMLSKAVEVKLYVELFQPTAEAIRCLKDKNMLLNH